MVRVYSKIGKNRNAYWILMGRSEGKRPLERPQDIGGWIIFK
jgi:hypothetical protein